MRRLALSLCSALCSALGLALALGAPAAAEPAARTLFGAHDRPSAQAPASHGSYSKGCLAGAVEIPADGPGWQAMRPSRNRAWGRPEARDFLSRLAEGAQAAGWPGVLVGDISQPRGGPMLSGHRSHQLGLDLDIWLTPAPERRLTRAEREQTGAAS
ncbi:penicillin-insensitive murein endopeptidase, partial [Rhodovulum sp. DZ06]|uniref:penicillin-insensitive murein endopeptidase n=1 Tax=Rhodovulum sp. DZ06 TaxID=3425126 RepID=UPI003D325B15